ncbi:hypothetical protein SAMN04487846_3632 [Microbacterium sp. cf046]|uniref:hypothetical protein n=1 Tax=Microbacterium sp. cf046 TaxID=1761803 RepID=UPI0008EC0BA5|nr:hypothetical protein [Microbacterium sp. cf046]SFS17699.1 hypothetical protein SAMN04487846_3632 [Microbacterium sp. cf046]
MDDDVTELAILRRRAYGPDADIDEDPIALARLVELESRVRHTFVDTAELVVAPAAPDLKSARVAAPTATVLEPPAPVPPSRSRYVWRVAIAASLAIVAIVLGAQAADAPTTPTVPVSARPAPAGAIETSAAVLVVVPLDRSLARYVPQTPQPVFPVEGELRWAESIGPHYGWTVWLARSVSGQLCILLEDDGRTHSRCVPEAQYLDGALSVSVPNTQVVPEYRPARMRAGQGIVYRWLAERGLSIELEEPALTYFGDGG